MDRRTEDPRINQLVADVAVLKDQMAENTAVTHQVRDILASFRIVAAVAKWIAIIVGGIAAIKTGHGWFQK
jgi:hypothetical protein